MTDCWVPSKVWSLEGVRLEFPWLDCCWGKGDIGEGVERKRMEGPF